MEPNYPFDHPIETSLQAIDVLQKSQKRIQAKIAVTDPPAIALYDKVWESVWDGLRSCARAKESQGLQTTLFTIRGGFNICDDFLRSGCLELASQAFTMTMAFCLPDDSQHKMDDCLGKTKVKVPDIGLGRGKIEIKKKP